jgi:hypothetical protein
MSKILCPLRNFSTCDIAADESVYGDFLEYFKDFDKVPAVQKIFGEKTFEILKRLKVEFCVKSRYMHVDSADGHVVINKQYIQNGDDINIYLDLIHELFHVKQFMDGLELFDKNYAYVDRPTEIEAFQYTVQEAKRIGLTDERICQYLKTEWINDADFKRLVAAVNLHV